jgi:hypothetical protein
VINSYQTELKKKFGFVENLPGVFINVEASNQDDIKAYQSFQAECSRLFQIISMLTIKDNMNHFSALRSENNILKGNNEYFNKSTYFLYISLLCTM